jgi:hypothetical protein
MTAKVIPFQTYQDRENEDRLALREEARNHLYAAASILSDLGRDEERISWLIDDCADFLLRDYKGGDDDNSCQQIRRQ